MTLLQIVVLGIVQGLTEFLPISSSGHLVMVPALTGWPDQGLTMDVAVHVGTLMAVVIYFWRDLLRMAIAPFLLRRKEYATDRKTLVFLIIATIPVMAAGFILHERGIETVRSLEVVAWALIGYGVLLYLSDRLGITIYRIQHMTFLQAVIIGLFQALAVIPGTSRSGITITAARFLGFERREAARFSMLLSIPGIAAAAVLTGRDLYATGTPAMTHDAMLAAGVSFATAILSIWFLMNWLKSSTFRPFVVYRIVVGTALLAWIYGWI